MIHDQVLLEALSSLPTEPFRGEVFRATGVSVDPTAPSINGGRWAPPPDRDPGIYVLYTSFEQAGALAEVCSFLADLTPVPKNRKIKVTRIGISVSRCVSLSEQQLKHLGVDMTQYGVRDYRRTQEIGAAISFLGADALIAPCARWPCKNLNVFVDNHKISETLEVMDEAHVEWRDWAEKNKIIS
jgi:hypothetical protein